MYKKADHCKHCELDFDNLSSSDRANHSRWCLNNPAREKYLETLKGSRACMTKESIEKQSNSLKETYAAGNFKREKPRVQTLFAHSAESKELIRQRALASTHRRLVRSIREYIKKDGSVVKLDSAWEEALAKRLDETDVTWERPSSIKWKDKNDIYHNYFPDFYLKDYDLYLDPKNPYAIKSQQAKLICLTSQLKNLIIITSLDDCKNFTPGHPLKYYYEKYTNRTLYHY